MERIKVFGVGFHKTATSSLAQVLSILGYSVTGPSAVHDLNIINNVRNMAQQLTSEFNAFQDNPWPLLYRDVDLWCPHSKFILTIRPVEQWIKSVVGHFGNASTPMRQWIYGVGTPVGNEAHNRKVLAYFKDRPEDLLVLRITDGEGWDKLCPFLGKDIPSILFPNINKAKNRKGINV